jgi:hypothetical protein
MTHRVYCDICKDYGYIYIDENVIEIIESCPCV